MLRVEVLVPKKTDQRRVVRLIERLCTKEGLQQRIKRSLQTYPGSVHCHYGRKGLAGTVEVTFWPSESKIWLDVHENRKAPWTTESVEKLEREIRSNLNKVKASF